MTQTVQANSLVTLHYRIALENGQPLISTFESNPATLQLGNGDMMPSLERLLEGLAVGTRQLFTLAPEQAFGPYNPELVEKVKREHMPQDDIEAMTIMEFGAPDGTRYQGLVREINDAFAVVDFNHPLAGKTIRFEVDIIGIV